MSGPTKCAQFNFKGAQPRITCRICADIVASRVVPKYGDKIPIATYCCTGCRDTHRPVHNNECLHLQTRRALARAAIFLREGWSYAKEFTFPNYYQASYDPSTGVVTLLINEDLPNHTLGPCGVNFLGDADARKGLLTFWTCITSLIYSYELTTVLMDG